MSTAVEGRLQGEAPFSSLEPEDHRTMHAEVWRIAWPSVLTFLLMSSNAMLDRFFVGKLGKEALAAVGVGGTLMFTLVSLSMAITVGTTALVARFTGSEQHSQAVRATGQSLALGLYGGIVCTAFVYSILGPFLHVMGLTSLAARECRQFIVMALLGMVPMFVSGVIGAAFRGLGDTRNPLKVMLCVNVVHIGFDWALIFGHLGLPKMGMAGAGLAMAIANTAALGVYAVLLRKSDLREAASLVELRLTLEWTRRVLKIGIPAAVTALLRVTSMMSFTGILARTAEHISAVAALPIGMTAESIAFLPGFGFSIAASALVGQSLGARNPDRAERYGWAATWQATAIMTAMGALFFVAAQPFASLFTQDHEVMHLAVLYLRINAISEPLLGIGMVLTGALQGAGETNKPALITLVTFWLFRIPVAWLLALRLGYQTTGAWTAMATTTVLAGVLTMIVYRAGGWKRVRV